MTTDSGWLTFTPRQSSGVDVYTGTIYYRKIGRIVEIMSTALQLSTTLTAGSYRALATVPSAYRPTLPDEKTMFVPLVCAGLAAPARAFIPASGGLSVFANATEDIPTTTNIYIHMIYFV